MFHFGIYKTSKKDVFYDKEHAYGTIYGTCFSGVIEFDPLSKIGKMKSSITRRVDLMEKRAVLQQIIKTMRQKSTKLCASPRYDKKHTIRVHDAGIDTYLYYPDTAKKENLPVFFNLHGGGFVLGKALDDDFLCRKLADDACCAVASIEYRLAPEYPFPIGLEDCYAVIRNLAGWDTFDAKRMAIGGHSAGGNLSAALCQLAKTRGEFSFVGQILDYPPMDLGDPFVKPTHPLAIPPQTAALFNEAYLQGQDEKRPLCSPVYAKLEELGGQPAALVITAEYDSLCAEAELYTAHLQAADVAVKLHRFKAEHGFTHMPTKYPIESKQACALMADTLCNWFV